VSVWKEINNIMAKVKLWKYFPVQNIECGCCYSQAYYTTSDLTAMAGKYFTMGTPTPQVIATSNVDLQTLPGTIDGTLLTSSSIIQLTAQTNPTENGYWVFTKNGSKNYWNPYKSCDYLPDITATSNVDLTVNPIEIDNVVLANGISFRLTAQTNPLEDGLYVVKEGVAIRQSEIYLRGILIGKYVGETYDDRLANYQGGGIKLNVTLDKTYNDCISITKVLDAHYRTILEDLRECGTSTKTLVVYSCIDPYRTLVYFNDNKNIHSSPEFFKGCSIKRITADDITWTCANGLQVTDSPSYIVVDVIPNTYDYPLFGFAEILPSCDTCGQPDVFGLPISFAVACESMANDSPFKIPPSNKLNFNSFSQNDDIFSL